MAANAAENENKENDEATELQSKAILVTGGAGYIGSHTVIELYEAGFNDIVIADNFINSSPKCISAIEKIIDTSITYYNIDLADMSSYNKLNEICEKHQFYCCIHFAGLKAVGESIKKPILYYRNNLVSTMNLIECLSNNNCNNLIFSSSATVYGNNSIDSSKISENDTVGIGMTNPYGKSKYFIEEILNDYCIANNNFNVVLLRYFNPIGAHPSGTIGEDPQGIPNNLMPFLSRVAIAQTKKDTDIEFYNKYKILRVFGDDWNTIDGTGVRDYIHVLDLAKGHVCALKNDIMLDNRDKNVSVYNLGSGIGTSVLQLKSAMQNACGFNIPHIIAERRQGDIAIVVADSSLAKEKIKFETKYNVEQACAHSWLWQSKNPYGFASQS